MLSLSNHFPFFVCGDQLHNAKVKVKNILWKKNLDLFYPCDSRWVDYWEGTLEECGEAKLKKGRSRSRSLSGKRLPVRRQSRHASLGLGPSSPGLGAFLFLSPHHPRVLLWKCSAVTLHYRCPLTCMPPLEGWEVVKDRGDILQTRTA